MKFFLKYLAAFILFVGLTALVMSIPGCNPNPAPDAAVILTEANDTLAATETVLTALDKQHAIPAAERPGVAAAVYVAQRDLATANANNGQSATTSVLAQLQADLDSVVKLRLKYIANPTTAVPSTQP